MTPTTGFSGCLTMTSGRNSARSTAATARQVGRYPRCALYLSSTRTHRVQLIRFPHRAATVVNDPLSGQRAKGAGARKVENSGSAAGPHQCEARNTGPWGGVRVRCGKPRLFKFIMNTLNAWGGDDGAVTLCARACKACNSWGRKGFFMASPAAQTPPAQSENAAYGVDVRSFRGRISGCTEPSGPCWCGLSVYALAFLGLLRTAAHMVWGCLRVWRSVLRRGRRARILRTGTGLRLGLREVLGPL